jgi:serine-type D-Ala-D-Ala carboxypeptidase/endopeptidase
MSNIVQPTPDQVEALVSQYLVTQPKGLAFAIGCASPYFPTGTSLYFFGNLQNQFGRNLTLDQSTPFEIASISKTFTATLYAYLIRTWSATNTVAQYILPQGPLSISTTLGTITLDSLMSYSSGLPEDNQTDQSDSPLYLPYPYSVQGMLGYLNADPPTLNSVKDQYAYSNLAFALMGAILCGGPVDPGQFTGLINSEIFIPLDMQSMFFDQVPLDQLPLGYAYDYSGASVSNPVAQGWPLFPAYYGAGGIVTSPNDMLQWLQFNMGILGPTALLATLTATQSPATKAQFGDNNLGLGWFISPGGTGWSPSIWKDGELDGFNSYIAFLPSPSPGSVASEAGVFVLVNASGITENQTNDGTEITAAIANDLLQMMQCQTPPQDKSLYPKTIARRRPRSVPRST